MVAARATHWAVAATVVAGVGSAVGCQGILGLSDVGDGSAAQGGAGASATSTISGSGGGSGGATTSGTVGTGGGGGQGGAMTSWSQPAWSKRMRLTVATANWPTGISDFPLAVSLQNDALDEARDDGFDLVFVDGDDNTMLDHEIEQFDRASGTLVAWVRVPQLTPPDPVVMYLYFGNPAATGSGSATAVWSASNHEGVWHLGEDLSAPPNAALDSSGNGVAVTSDPATAHPTTTEGVLGNALDYDGIDDYLQAASAASLEMGSDSFTASCWVSVQGFRSIEDTPLYKGGPDPIPGYAMVLGDAAWIAKIQDGNLDNRIVSLGSFGGFDGMGWAHLAMVVDRPNNGFRAYVNGVGSDTNTLGAVDSVQSSERFQIGRKNNQPFQGQIDEVRISRLVRSDDWIKLMHDSVRDWDTRFTPGVVESRP
jgi:biopolymer transport protein ExbB